MFTHDAHKKAKKWHDGSLRYHTFNKRVMVYDDSKNFVGGLHYRSTEDFSEGLELNLDTHILVQVEERLGQSNTDLTPLLGRHKQDDTTSPARPNPPTRANMVIINAANPHARPKSIKELLAGSRGNISQARLPIKSPYEQKRALAETQPKEKDSKRRKIAHGEENNAQATSAASKAAEPHRPLVLQDAAIDVSQSGDSSASRRHQREPDWVEHASFDLASSVILPKPDVVIAKPKPKPPSDQELRERRKKQKTDAEHALSREQNTSKGLSKLCRDVSASDTAAVTERIPSETSKSFTAGPRYSDARHLAGPRSTLKFSQKKSRPRLMYQALLTEPSKPRNSDNETSMRHGSRNGKSPVSANDSDLTLRRRRQTNLIDADNLFNPARDEVEVENRATEHPEPLLVQEPLDNLPSDRRLASVEQGAVDDDVASTPPSTGVCEAVPDSPLFMPRNASQITLSPSQAHIINDDHLSFLSQQALRRAEPGRRLDRVIQQNSCTPTPGSGGLSGKPLAIPSSPVFHRLDPPAASPEQFAAVLPFKPSEYPPAESPKPSGFSTSLSVGVASREQSLPQVTLEEVQHMCGSVHGPPRHTDENHASLGNSPHSHSFGPDQEDENSIPVQPDSISNAIDIHSSDLNTEVIMSSVEIEADTQQPCAEGQPVEVPLATKPPVAVDAPVEESGPWTSTEAFLLFDWWPPGRQKPAYHDKPASNRTARTNNGASSRPTKPAPTMSNRKYGTFGSARLVSQR